VGVALEVGACEAGFLVLAGVDDAGADGLRVSPVRRLEHLVLRQTRDLDVDVDAVQQGPEMRWRYLAIIWLLQVQTLTVSPK